MKRHRCHVPDISGTTITLSNADAHHLTHVLRVTAGAALAVFDGRGRERAAVIQRVARHEVTIGLGEWRDAVAEPPVEVTLAVALLTGDQMSTVVRDATAMGVSAIRPFVSTHVALPAGAWRTRAIERWTRIASSSAAQCGRAVVPALLDVAPFAEVLSDETVDLRLICVEPRHDAAISTVVPTGAAPARALLMVGPEGGWSEGELAAARAAGAHSLGLGPRTLRAELAPTVALTVLWNRYGWG